MSLARSGPLHATTDGPVDTKNGTDKAELHQLVTSNSAIIYNEYHKNQQNVSVIRVFLCVILKDANNLFICWIAPTGYTYTDHLISR